ncbi:MAG: Fic family protein [Mycobacterium leprae]
MSVSTTTPAGPPPGADLLAPLADVPAVAVACADARRAVDRLLAHPVLRRRGPEVAAEAALRGARSSAALEGVDVPLDRLRTQSVAGDVTGEMAGGSADAIVAGAVRVQAELAALVPAWRRAPRQVLARLHALACAGQLPDEQLGRPRAGGLDPGADPLGIGAAPSPGVVASRLDALAHVVTAPTRAPAPIVVAIVHGELLALRPFAAGNGLVARASARLVGLATGLDPKGVSAPEVGHEELTEEYAEAARGYAAGDRAGVVTWVVHCCQAIALGARESIAICEALGRAQ